MSIWLLLFILVKMKIVPFNLFWKVSPVIVLLLLLIGLFIPMNWGAPQGPALVVRNSVPIVPDVAGEVIDVPVEPNKPLKAGDVLFRIDPTPFEASLQAIEAQLKFEQLRLSQMKQLQLGDSGRAFDVEQRQAEVDQLQGQFAGAKWNLDKTVVRAPADGLCDESRAAQGRAGQQYLGCAGDGVHRYVGHHRRRRDPADRRALSRARSAGRS